MKKSFLLLSLLIILISSQTASAAFKGFLKADTAVDVMIGPFTDDTDGKTAETGLTITQSEVRLSKNGGNMAQKNEATSLTHDELGKYVCKLDATDTNTEGILTVTVWENGALICDDTYMVVNANIYDSFFAAATTDYLQIDIKQAAGDNIADGGDGLLDVNIKEIDGSDVPVAKATLVTDGVSLAAIRKGFMLVDTTIAAYTSNTSFTLTAGPYHDTAVVGCTCIIIDQSDATQIAVGRVSAYTTAANTVTLESDPLAAFTFANGDYVYILPCPRGKDAVAILDDTDDIGAAGAGLTAINLPNQTMDIIGDITGNLSGAVGSVSGNVDGDVSGNVTVAGSVAEATTIAAYTSNTSFTITDGSPNDNAYIGCKILIVDQSDSTQVAVGLISAYTTAANTITLAADPLAAFTFANGDLVYILPNTTISSTDTAAIADAVRSEPVTSNETQGTIGWLLNLIGLLR